MQKSRFTKILISLLLIATCTYSSYAQEIDLFEGSITFRVRSAQGSNEMKQYIKQKKLRVEMISEGKILSIGLADYSNKAMFMIYPDKGVYSEISISPESISAEAKRSLADTKIFETGRVSTILGYSCKEWRYQKDLLVTEIWVASGFGKFLDTIKFGADDPLAEWRRNIMGAGGFPLRIIEYDQNGRELTRMDAIAVDKSTLDEEIFELPKGVKKLKTDE